MKRFASFAFDMLRFKCAASESELKPALNGLLVKPLPSEEKS